MGAWLEEQGHKSYFINYDEQFGIVAGAEWEQVLYQRLRQCQAIVALVTPDWLESKWCFAEMIQAREKGKPIFPVIAKPCQLPDLLSDTQKIDLIADPEAVIGVLLWVLGNAASSLPTSGIPRGRRIRDSLPFRRQTPRCFSDVVPKFSSYARCSKDSGVTTRTCSASSLSWVRRAVASPPW